MITEAKRIANHDRVVELLNSVSRNGLDDTRLKNEQIIKNFSALIEA